MCVLHLYSLISIPLNQCRCHFSIPIFGSWVKQIFKVFFRAVLGLQQNWVVGTEISHISPVPTHISLPYFHRHSPEWYLFFFFTKTEPTLTHHNHLNSIHSLFTFGFTLGVVHAVRLITFIMTCTSLLYCTEYFHCSKNHLCSVCSLCSATPGNQWSFLFTPSFCLFQNSVYLESYCM